MKITKELREILELGQECGLDTVDEAIDNAMLHYAVFHFPITNDILNETIPIANQTIDQVLK